MIELESGCAAERARGVPPDPDPRGPGDGEDSLVVEEVHGLEQLRRFRREWQDLHAGANEPDFFQSWEWMETWLECFASPTPLTTLLFRRAGSLVAALPLVGAPRGLICRQHTLVGAVNKQTPRGGVLIRGQVEPVLRALLGHLEQRGPVRLVLPRQPDPSALLESLPRVARTLGYSALAHAHNRQPRLRIETDWAGFVGSRPRRIRSEWRRKQRRIERAGHVRFETVTTVSGLERAMPAVLEIERNSWKHDHGTSFDARAELADFYGKLAAACASRGWLRLHLLHLDDRPIAHALVVAHARTRLALKTSYDRSGAAHSPGIVVMLRALQDAFAEGAEAFEFLGSDSRWKDEMANDWDHTRDLCISSAYLLECRAHTLYGSRVKPFLKQRVPALARWKEGLLASLRGKRA